MGFFRHNRYHGPAWLAFASLGGRPPFRVVFQYRRSGDNRNFGQSIDFVNP